MREYDIDPTGFLPPQEVKTMQSIRDFLKGKKTYLTAAIGLLGAVAAWANGDINGIGLLAAIWAAVQACCIRAAVGTEVQKVISDILPPGAQ